MTVKLGHILLWTKHPAEFAKTDSTKIKMANSNAKTVVKLERTSTLRILHVFSVTKDSTKIKIVNPIAKVAKEERTASKRVRLPSQSALNVCQENTTIRMGVHFVKHVKLASTTMNMAGHRSVFPAALECSIIDHHYRHVFTALQECISSLVSFAVRVLWVSTKITMLLPMQRVASGIHVKRDTT